MAVKKDQHSDPPAEDPTIIPLKKRSMAEKSLPGSNKAAESISELDSESSDSGDDKDMIDNFAEEFKKKKLEEFKKKKLEEFKKKKLEEFKKKKLEEFKKKKLEEFKKKKVEELKRKAFYSVLLAFNAEALTIQYKRTQIIEKLMKEWNIAPETRSSFEDQIQKNLIAQQERVDLDVKETEIVEAKPLTISEKKPTLVTPEALVGRRVLLKLPFEDHYEDLVIKEYNAKDGMHRLEPADSDAMLIWMDLREVRPQDIIWRDGENPNIEAPGLGAGQR